MQGIRRSAIAAGKQPANKEATEEVCDFLKIIYFSSQFTQNIRSEGDPRVTQFNFFIVQMKNEKSSDLLKIALVVLRASVDGF